MLGILDLLGLLQGSQACSWQHVSGVIVLLVDVRGRPGTAGFQMSKVVVVGYSPGA